MDSFQGSSVSTTNSITFNIDSVRKLENNKSTLYLFLYHYFYTLIYFTNGLFSLFYFFLDHPDFTKSFGGILIFISTNVFLFYDFLSPYFKYLLYFLPDVIIEFFNDFYVRIIQIPISFFNFVSIVYLSLKLFLRDGFTVFFLIIEIMSCCFILSVNKIYDCTFEFLNILKELTIVFFNYFSILAFYCLKFFGCYCSIVLLFYLLVYLIDFFDCILKRKIVSKLLGFIKMFSIIFAVMLRKFCSLIYTLIFRFDCFESPDGNNSRQIQPIADKETGISPCKQRHVTFNNSVTVINVDYANEKIQHQFISSICRGNKKRKCYNQFQTFNTFEQGMQRMKDDHVEHQFYTFR
jgi:hypothetical protein